MLDEIKIRKILKERYHLDTGNILLGYKELEKCFKLYHKYLAGQYNVNSQGYHYISNKYCNMRDSKKLRSLVECIQLY